MSHRGRFQAQGKRLEESESWAKDLPLNYNEGLQLLVNLENKIPRKDLLIRSLGFKQCRRCIENASKNNGINVLEMGKPFIKSFPKNYQERVDLEVHKGIAFIL
jgi:hypothetical protein